MTGVSAAPLLACRGVTKIFPGVRALEDVDFAVHAGEIVALVGENGAGKSTLMKVLAGLHVPTSGDVQRDGANVAIVHQELCLADNLTAGQNVCLGREPLRAGILGRMGFLDDRTLHERANRSLARVGAQFPARTSVARLSIGERQLVEIAAALDREADVLILDEPTSSLTPGESERLFEVLEALRADGIGIVYVSHRLPEVVRLSDRAVVLRDGQRVGALEGDALTREELVRHMIGRQEVARPTRPTLPHHADVTLRCRAVCTEAWPSATIDLSVRRGEIVGIAGLVGAGRSELLETIAGLRTARAGTVEIAGDDVTSASPRFRYDRGMGLVPEDRAGAGLFTNGRVDENLTLASAHRRARGPGLVRKLMGGFVHRARERTVFDQRASQLDVRAASPSVAVNSLSGGNQQKILLGRWIDEDLAVLLLDEPTRGVDVGARESLYAVLEAAASGGAGILFASSDLEEVRRLSHRVLVMHDGRIAGELDGNEATEEAVMNLATGTLGASA